MNLHLIQKRVLAAKGAIDPDAALFLTASGITDTTITNAVNYLVVELKKKSLWGKMTALYPFVGGTAFSHKFNLKDPRDLNASYRLVFNGSWTHSSLGALGPNGNFANTFLNPFLVFGSNYAHQSFYNFNLNTSGTIIQGAVIDGRRFDMGYDQGSSAPFSAIGSSISNIATDTSNVGFILSYRTSTNSGKMLRNNILLTNINLNFLNYPNGFYYLNNRNPNQAAFKGIGYSFASIGYSITDNEANNFNSIVQNFQTYLLR